MIGNNMEYHHTGKGFNLTYDWTMDGQGRYIVYDQMGVHSFVQLLFALLSLSLLGAGWNPCHTMVLRVSRVPFDALFLST